MKEDSSDGVLHRREYTIFGAPRQLRIIPSAKCRSSRSASLSSSFSILLTLLLKDSATKLGLLMAAPKIPSPSLLFLFTLLSMAFRSAGDQSSLFSILGSKPHLSTKFVNKFNAAQVFGGYQQGCHHPNTNYAVLDLIILFQIL